jgi:hypothetical protein
MKWNRKLFSLALALALSAGVSCTAADSPMGPQASEQTAQPSYLLDGLLAGDGLVGDVVNGAVGTVLGATDLLVCRTEPYKVAAKTVGADGGTINIGNHTLVIPRGALKKNTKITAEQMPGRTNSIRFSPEGLQFQRPAALTMSYKNCLVVLVAKKIAYTDENLKILEVLRSLDLFSKKIVTAPIDHFSRYAVTW